MIPQVTLTDSHKAYKRECQETGRAKWYREEVYLKIAGGFMDFIIHQILDGHEVRLGSGETLGTIFVKGKRELPKINADGEIRGLAPDWQKTAQFWRENPEAKEKGIKIYHTNDHSEGVRYNLVWIKGKMRWQNKMLYSLTFSKRNRRLLTKMIKTEGKEYYVAKRKIL